MLSNCRKQNLFLSRIDSETNGGTGMKVRNDAFNIRRLTQCLFVLGMALILTTAARTAFCANLTLAWDANSEPDLSGYLVFCGESSGHYSITKEVISDNPGERPPNTCEFTGMEEGATYYFTAIAFSDNGQSDYSREISYTVPTATVDPRTSDDDDDGYSENQGDCNDNNASVNPGATDVCGDGIDQDCSGGDLVCPDLMKDSDNDGLTDAEEEIYHTDPMKSDSDGDGVSDGEEVAGGFDPLDRNSTPVDTAWHSASNFSAVHVLGTGNKGILETEFDAIPLINRLDGVIGYADSSVGITAYNSMAMLVRMNENGRFDARNGGTYDSDVDVPYTANGIYHVRLVAEINAGTYDVWVTPQNGAEIQIANDYAFRSDAPPTDDFGKVCLIDGIGEFKVENHTIAPFTIPTDPRDSDKDGDGYSANQGDCNDDSANVYPSAVEVCGDGIDQDCNGRDSICVDYSTDTDHDGLTDYEERNTYFTDPNKADTDGDTVTDGDEIAAGFDPNDAGSKPDSETFDLPLEAGEIEVDGQWKTVLFDQPFDVPVVIANGLSYSGQDPAVIRIRNVTQNGFDVRVQEWDYLDGNHPNEKVNYVVVESGTYELPGGTRVEAGRFAASAVSSFAAVPFKHSFGTVPVVMTSITTANEGNAVTMRVRNISTTKFDYLMQEQEANSQQHVSEEAGYIAWEPSAGSVDDLIFEIGRTSNSVTHSFQALNFYEPFTGPPVFVADMQTTDGGDTATVRCQNKQAGRIDIKVEEEQSKDTEINHTTEVIGYMIFEANNPLQDDGIQIADSLISEAEEGVLSGGFDVGSDAAASGGKYVHVPGWSLRKYTPDENQKVEFTFNVSNGGNYRIKGWVYAPDGSRDSFFVKVNDQPSAGYEWHVLQNTTYAPDYVRDGVWGRDPVEIRLNENSTATVTVYLREAQTRLDKIELELVK